MPNAVILSPLLARLSGTMSHPNSALVVRYTGVGKGALITPKSHGGPETKTKIWRLTQWIWNYLDAMWSNLPQSSRLLWHAEAHNTKHQGRDGFALFKRVNIMRLLFWFPPLPRPPNTCNSIRQLIVQSEHNPGLNPGIAKWVWISGTMMPKGPDDPFDPETPDTPLPPLPPPDIDEPADPPGPPFPPCYPQQWFTLTATSGPNGHLNPEGIVPMRLGQSLRINSYPDCGFQCDTLTEGGLPVFPPCYCSLINVHFDRTVHATYKRTYLDQFVDHFDRPYDGTLGRCWYHRPTSNMATFTFDHCARSNYLSGGPADQTNHEYCHQQLNSYGYQKVSILWNGVATMGGDGRYCSKLNIRILMDDAVNPTHMVYATLDDQHDTGNTAVSLWHYDASGGHRFFYARQPDNLAGTWDLFCRHTSGADYLFVLNRSTLPVGSAHHQILYPGRAVGFSHRMTRLSAHPCWGSSISHYFAAETPEP